MGSSMLLCNAWVSMEENKSPEFKLIQSTQVTIFAIFRNNLTIIIIWKNKKGALPAVENNIIILGPEIPHPISTCPTDP